MSRFGIICCISALTGCTAYLYEPDLATKPADQTKYKSDLTACQDELQAKRNDNLGYTVFGGIGYAVMMADGKEDTTFGAQGIINKCMASKGYEIKS